MMPNEHENPQSPHHGQPNPAPGEQQTPQNPNDPRRKQDQGHKHGQGGDEGKVGQDTDGDGKVVKPGEKPGQSGGAGLPEDK
jgi:hypothetical protein